LFFFRNLKRKVLSAAITVIEIHASFLIDFVLNSRAKIEIS
jgi:hypothetical protein